MHASENVQAALGLLECVNVPPDCEVFLYFNHPSSLSAWVETHTIRDGRVVKHDLG